MSTHPYRLTFILPDRLFRLAKPGKLLPCLFPCALTVHRAGLVEVFGPSRQKVFEVAANWLRKLARGQGPVSISASLQTSTPPAGSDPWTIVTGAQVAFTPGALGADLFTWSEGIAADNENHNDADQVRPPAAP